MIDRGDEPVRRTSGRASRWVLIALAVVSAAVLVAVAAWIALLPDTDAAALAAVLDDPSVTVARDGDAVVLSPVGDGSDTTVVFYPGAGVPPDAYLATWAPVVADTGVTVVIPNVPLRLAVLDADVADDVRRDLAPDGDAGRQWWVGGHSLGGAMAASYLADAPAGDWAGLVLWAAFPAGDGLAGRDDLTVVSVSGTRDGLTTPQDVEDSRGDLPADTTFAVLDGVSHAQFGTYGDQRGDGEPAVGDAAARSAVAAATTAALIDVP